jgi:uncharacterized protein YutE (UPF0331/DUF86 family)
VVDQDVVRRKSQAVLHHLGRLHAKSPLDVASLSKDEDLWNAVLMDLLQAVQGCIDLGIHVVAHEGLGTPETPAAAFAVLAQRGVIAQDLATRLAAAAGLRNMIAHRYGDLSQQTMADVVARDLVHLETFISVVRQRAGLP